jgi:hypothetical protein
MSAHLEPNMEWLLDYEVRLSARHRRFVSLVMIDTDKPRKSLEKVLSKAIRSSDVCFPENGGLAIVMGETGSSEALQAIERYNQNTSGIMDICYSVASYPADAKTLDELKHVAQRRLEKAKTLESGSVVAEG